MRMSITLERIVQSAVILARKAHHQFITSEHLLFAMLGTKITTDVIRDCGANGATLKKSLKTYLDEKIPLFEKEKLMNPPQETVGFQTMMSRAVFICAEGHRAVLDIGDVLVSMFDEKQSYASYYMKLAGVERNKLILCATKNNAFQTEEAALATQKSPDALAQFCVDMTQKSAAYDPLIGRVNEIERIVEILCRRAKNNVLITGDAGVGKTAIIEGLAKKIAKGEIEQLAGFTIFSADIGFLVAGSRFRGDFEERFSSIINALKKRKKCILFIDEIHSIFGAGAGQGSVDAASMLKSALLDKSVRVIGSTTFEEYSRNFEKDRALNRRFQRVVVKEPSRDEAIKILTGLEKRYEEFHKVKFSKQAIVSAVDLTARYLNDKRLPDKAIDAIDEAASWLKIHTKNYKFHPITLGKTTELKNEINKEIKNSEEDCQEDTLPVVTTATIKKIVGLMAGVKIDAVAGLERERLANLADTIESQLFGQKAAIETIAKAVKMARAGLKNPDKPDGSFLFVGPTGVGKTELAKLLAKTLSQPLLRFDMSEYQEKASAARLIGAPAGYIGHDEGGILTERVRKNPRAVILFDEIEKADHEVFNIFLQLMDYGFVTDSRGLEVDFRNTLVIMTSNTGATDALKRKMGFGEEDFEDDLSSDNGNTQKKQLESDYLAACEKEFTAEFRNRLTAIVPFFPLSKHTILDIVNKECTKLKEKLKKQRVQLAVTDAAKALLAQKGYSREFGARNIERVVEDYIAAPLVDKILFEDLKGFITADCEGERIFFSTGGVLVGEEVTLEKSEVDGVPMTY